MSEIIQSAVAALKERFGAESYEFRGEVSLTLEAEHIVAA